MGESTARIGVYADDKASPVITSVQGRLQGLAATAKSSILMGVGLGSGVAAFGLLQRAVGGVVDILGEAVTAAIQDESSIRRLTASLQANVPAWDGNTDAIEKRILAGQKLGFTDDELRASLTVLVGATHDVSRAQELQSAAMDLARFKGIDLGTATDALVKIEGGRYRILASLGIKMREGATATEVLAAVQAVAAGQAKAFGETTEGAMASAGIAIEELKEEVGRALLPALLELSKFTRDTLIPAIRDLASVVGEGKINLGLLGDAIGLVKSGFDVITAPVRLAGDAFGELTKSAYDANAGLATMPAGMRSAMEGSVAAAVQGTGVIVDEFEQLPTEMASAMLRGEQELVNAATELVAVTKQALTPAQQLAAAIGFLSSSAYANAIASGKPAAIARATELRNAALQVMSNQAGFYTGGYNISASWVNGLTAALNALKYRATNAMYAYKAMLIGFSPPREGPLKDIDKGAFNIGRAWTKGFAKGIGRPSIPGLSMPGIGRSEGGGGFTGGGFGGGGGRMAGEVHIHIDQGAYIDGPSIDLLANKITERLRFAPGT